MKFLINPFFWYLALQSAGLLALQRSMTGPKRAMMRGLLFLTLLLALVSTPLVSKGLEASLAVRPKLGFTTAPAFIFVLGGGYRPGAIPDEDILVAESQRRVLHGITLWRRFPDARLVFSGAENGYKGIRGADRAVLLMAETARSHGVPAEALLLESRSRNTREHPVQALTLPGVTSSKPVAVVTSAWHMRRAKGEFCRYFQQVHTYPVRSMPQRMGWNDLVPDVSALDANTTLLREWLGLLWYALLTAQQRSR